MQGLRFSPKPITTPCANSASLLTDQSFCEWSSCVRSCLRVPIDVKRHNDHSNSCKGKYSIGVAHLQFSGPVPYNHGGT